jgi:hypothetical protein
MSALHRTWNCGDGDSTAIHDGEVVETQEVAFPPTRPCSSGMKSDRLGLPPVLRDVRDSEKKVVTGFLVWEANGGPRAPIAGRVA